MKKPGIYLNVKTFISKLKIKCGIGQENKLSDQNLYLNVWDQINEDIKTVFNTIFYKKSYKIHNF